jgi:SAM-dependent methyltransferase
VTADGGRPREAYATPLYYHIAFELNRKTETDFLEACFRTYARRRGRPVRAVVDLACGTGHHSLRLARRGYRMTGLDLSEASIAFLRAEARRAGLPIRAAVGDMTDFHLPRPVEAAICMQDSQGHLLTNETLVAHLRAVRRNLRPGGVFVFDRLVPNGWAKPHAHWVWTKRARGITVRTSFRTLLNWNLAHQTCEEVMRFEVTERGGRRVLTQRHTTRVVFPQELRALVELAGGFELCGWFSNFSLRRPLERAATALVMITVLRAC